MNSSPRSPELDADLFSVYARLAERHRTLDPFKQLAQVFYQPSPAFRVLTDRSYNLPKQWNRSTGWLNRGECAD